MLLCELQSFKAALTVEWEVGLSSHEVSTLGNVFCQGSGEVLVGVSP